MVKLTKASVEKMAAEMPPTNESNPQAMPQSVSMYGYTLDQFLEMYDRGTWTGGYIVSFGKEFGQSVEVRYKNDVYYLDGYDSEGNPYPDDPELGGSGEGGDDSGLIPGGDDPVKEPMHYTYDQFREMLENGTWKDGFVDGYYFDRNGKPAIYGGVIGSTTVVGKKENKVVDAIYTFSSAFGASQTVKNELIKLADEGMKKTAYMRISMGATRVCTITSVLIDAPGAIQGDWDDRLHIGEEAAAALLLRVYWPAGIILTIMNATGATDKLVETIIQLFPNQ